MLALLERPGTDGFPAEYLFARLRSRRRRLAGRRTEIVRMGGSERRAVELRDLRWVFETMGPRMRILFAPCYLYFELRPLLMMLRWTAGRDAARVAGLVRTSLLEKTLLDQLQACDDVDRALALLERRIDAAGGGSLALLEAYRRDGFRAAEEALSDGWLRAVARLSEAGVRDFIASVIDMRNLLAVARCRRWELDGLPLLDGGTEVSVQLVAAARQGDVDAVIAAAKRHLGDLDDDAALLESRLLTRIGSRLERLGRDPLGPGLVLDYLWRRHMATRTAGLTFWAGEEIEAWEQMA